MNDQKTPEARTEVVIRTDSGDSHTGFLNEADLEKVRRVMVETPNGSIVITLYVEATGNRNNHIQIVAAKIESLKLL